MTSKKNKGINRIGRGKFLRFLGGIGLLSLIPGLQANAEEKLEMRKFTGLRRTTSTKLLRSPTIKGKLLSEEALTTRLSTKNLENIRDMMTGRFFGRVAENAFRDGYVPLIKWGLGQKGSDTGCFFYAKLGPEGLGPEGLGPEGLGPEGLGPEGLRPEGISNCSLFVNARTDGKMIFLDIYSISAISQSLLDLGSECALVLDCPSDCTKCGVYCAGVYCAPHASFNLHEIVSYPADKFASELTDILKTTDIDKVQQEIKNVIFSDESLNMGLQHFVNGAYGGMIDDIEAKI
jgi:hypothetical protein